MSFKHEKVQIPNKASTLEACLTVPNRDLGEFQHATCVILTHGAGGDMDHDQLIRLAEALARAVRAFAAAKSYLESRLPNCRIILAGRSMGSRAALQFSNELKDDESVQGVLFLAYPLHTPVDTGNLRDKPLFELNRPCAFISGTNDAMCSINLLRATLSKMDQIDPNLVRLELIEGADHSYKAKGGNVVYERNVAQMIKTSVEWCKLTLGLHNNNEEDAQKDDEQTPAAKKKRERPDESAKTSSSKRSKTNTLEGYFTKTAK